MTIDWEKNLGWTPSAHQLQKFEQFYEQLLTANRALNLTRITSRSEFWEKHLWDSLSGIIPWLVEGQKEPWMDLLAGSMRSCNIIDIGTGGGFPGIPVAIACPQWRVTLLDSTQKKINSLSQILHNLNCETVIPVCDRAEVLGHHEEHRNHYDLALIRAVASAPTCAEYALPLVREQGIVILYRGQWDEFEDKSLCQALKHLGGELCHTQSFQTPLSASDRHCIYLKKTQPTPERYPRRVGVPTKKPLG